MTIEPVLNDMFIKIVDANETEISQLDFSFTKKPKDWFFIKKKNPHYDPEKKFFKADLSVIPYGLYNELIDLCNQYGFNINVKHPRGINCFSNSEYNEEELNKWLDETFKDCPFKPYDHQIEAFKISMLYNKCTQEISTSGGKTLISYMIFKYLFDKKIIKKMIYIVPNVSLATQTEEKFYEYSDTIFGEVNFKSKCIFSETSKQKDDFVPNVIFGTFQSLVKKDPEFYKDVDFVFVDECHHAKASSIQKITMNCVNASFKLGLTGTMPKKGTYESFVIQSYIGPTVNKLTSNELIQKGNATPINVVRIVLDYMNDEQKSNLYKLRNVHWTEKDSLKLYNLEKKIIRDNPIRFDYICNMLKKTTKNTLLLFSDVRGGYGKKFYEWLKTNTDREVFYVDGDTTNNHREFYKDKMKNNKDIIIIASVGTFGEGIDVPNIYNIFLAESSKSEIVVSQILGRGMRQFEGKEKVIMIDFIDDFCYGSGNQKYNYLYKHGKERENIYKARKFPYATKKVLLRQTSQNLF